MVSTNFAVLKYLKIMFMLLTFQKKKKLNGRTPFTKLHH